MKHQLTTLPCLLCGLVLACALFTTSAMGQITVRKYPANPILTAGAAGAWDEHMIFSGSVVYAHSRYHMWYCGGRDSIVSIGYASSHDGTTWTKYEGNPVLTPGGVSDFDAHIGGCYVLYYSNSFHMWYNAVHEGVVRIGCASSGDGINWTKHHACVFENVNTNGWDEIFGGLGPVVKEDTLLKMFYWGRTPTTWWKTGLAISTDSYHWTSIQSIMFDSSAGADTSWDHDSQAISSVLGRNGNYEMWYDNQKHAPFCIGYARSTNGGLNWTPASENPIVHGDPGAWDAAYTIYPMVVKEPDGGYLLYYTGGKTRDAIPGIGLAIVDTVTSERWMSKFATGVSDGNGAGTGMPQYFSLLQNYPNPFNPTTRIRYALKTACAVNLVIYNVLGQAVAVLVNDQQPAGWREVEWNTKDISSGIYFSRLQAGTFVETKKIIVVK
jgi:predicted GH43/DUF377 family glycosyl hydrolase